MESSVESKDLRFLFAADSVFVSNIGFGEAHCDDNLQWWECNSTLDHYLAPNLIAKQLNLTRPAYLSYGENSDPWLMDFSDLYRHARGFSGIVNYFPSLPTFFPEVHVPSPSLDMVVYAAVGPSLQEWFVTPEYCVTDEGLEITPCNTIEVLPHSLSELSARWLTRADPGEINVVVLSLGGNDFLRFQDPDGVTEQAKGIGRGLTAVTPEEAIKEVRKILDFIKAENPMPTDLHVFMAEAPEVVRLLDKVASGKIIVFNDGTVRESDGSDYAWRDAITLSEPQVKEQYGLPLSWFINFELTEQDVLTAAEYEYNLHRTEEYNRQLRELAENGEYPFLHLFDYNDLIKAAQQDDGVFIPTTDDNAFIPRGYLLADDNLHPGPVMQTLITNKILAAMNTEFATDFPLFSNDQICAIYLEDRDLRPSREDEGEKDLTGLINTAIRRISLGERLPTATWIKAQTQ